MLIGFFLVWVNNRWMEVVSCFSRRLWGRNMWQSPIKECLHGRLTTSKGWDTLGDKSLQHFAGTGRRNNSPHVTRLILWKSLLLQQNFVAVISCTNSNQFEFVWLIAARKLANTALLHRVYASGNKSLQQDINELMRERHIHVVHHIELEN